MSSFLRKANNPKTDKLTKAIFHDDHYGRHQYGVCFRKDGKHAKIKDIELLKDLYDSKDYDDGFDCYPEEEISIKFN